MDETLDVDALIETLIDREGGYVNRLADKGWPTCFGITEAVARAHGYAGPMRSLPRGEAAAIYRRLYWQRPRLDEIASRSRRVAAELFDTGVNMGPGGRGHLPPARADCAQPRRPRLSRSDPRWPDRARDAGRARCLATRGRSSGETVLLRALEALQGERYLRLAERRPANEAFLYGWLANRIGDLG